VCICGPSILTFANGGSKGERNQRLERNNLGGRIGSIEAVDKVTDRGFAAKSPKCFEK
jgi:hypothetical protein